MFKNYDVSAELARLDFADFCFTGKGEKSEVVIGIERKTTGDLISCMRDKRFAGYQLPGLVKTYDWIYLVVEGVWRAGRTGALESLWRKDWRTYGVGGKPILFREVDHFLTTLQNRVGVIVRQTSNEEQTAALIVSLYKWWEKPWGQHDSFKEIYAPSESMEASRRGRFIIHTPTFTEKVAAQLPGIGKSAFTVAKRMKTVKRMVEADVSTWAELKLEVSGKDGKGVKRLGDKRAAVIYDILRRE